tara:strand:- start:1450 stop:1563 length:114 start_codon:yes stop_codon:yes gene_type:complete
MSLNDSLINEFAISWWLQEMKYIKNRKKRKEEKDEKS